MVDIIKLKLFPKWILSLHAFSVFCYCAFVWDWISTHDFAFFSSPVFRFSSISLLSSQLLWPTWKLSPSSPDHTNQPACPHISLFNFCMLNKDPLTVSLPPVSAFWVHIKPPTLTPYARVIITKPKQRIHTALWQEINRKFNLSMNVKFQHKEIFSLNFSVVLQKHTY